MKVKQTLREIIDKTRDRENKHFKKASLIASIPTLIFVIVTFVTTHNWDVSRIVLFPFAITGLYLVSIIAIFDVFFSRSIYEVLSPILNRKIKRLFNAPNRIDVSPQTNETSKLQNTLVNNPNIEKLLTQIAEDYQNLGNKKMPEVVTEIYKKFGEIDQTLAKIQESAKIGYYPCNNNKCQKLFMAKSQDDIFTIAMREKCEYCNILNMTMFRRKNYICDFCGEDNYIFWHHKDGHTNDEVRLAERKFDE